MRTAATALTLFTLLLPQFGDDLVVTEVELKADPVTRIRPEERVIVQLVARSVVSDPGASNGELRRKVRVPARGARIRLAGDDSGVLSKPFSYTGGEQEPFYEKPGRGWARILLGRVTREVVIQDAALYTAPAKPGRYTIEGWLGQLNARLEIEVDPEAEPVLAAETTAFEPEKRPAEPFRNLAEHYAPFVAQETWFDPKSDYLARFDFDGDWDGDNNWESAPTGSSQAYVYYAAMATDTHWFLVYNFFHPRDYSDKCLPEMCHENDNEGLVLTIRRNGDRFGQLEAMETLAHNNIYSYRGSKLVGNAVHRLDGQVELVDESHPAVFIESGGHGVYGSDDDHSRYSVDRGTFYEGTGVTYIYKGAAERPPHPDARRVGYDLLPIYHHWWLRARHREGGGRTFDDYFDYRPFGGRPDAAPPQLAGAFLGRAHGRNKAKPFWGWHDKRTRDRDVLARGQWGLDPAYGVSRNLLLPQPVSLDYTYNPYLGVGTPEREMLFDGRP